MHKDDVKQRPPIHWGGVLFSLALNLILSTLADFMINQLALMVGPSVTIRLLAPLLAGILTALYVGERGGIHALLGGLLSVPLLATVILPGAWRVSLLVGVVCALGGALTEFVRQRR